MNIGTKTKLIAAAALVVAALSSSAMGADPARGRALYESRCDGCHSTGVHQRASREANDFAGIRFQVERWNTQLGGAWGRGEIDDVVVYLNDRFYKYPCPDARCRAGAANSSTDGLVVARRGGERSGHVRTRVE